MSSLDMVAYINATRKPGEAELRHTHFLAKVPTVLKDSAKFLAQYKDSTGRTLPCYYFPEQESMFMAMSYSYELQQTVYRSWKTELAKNTGVPALGLPTTYLDALKQLVSTVEHSEKQAAQANIFATVQIYLQGAYMKR